MAFTVMNTGTVGPYYTAVTRTAAHSELTLVTSNNVAVRIIKPRSHCHDCGHDYPRLTVDGLVGASREYKAPNLIFLRMPTTTVR